MLPTLTFPKLRLALRPIIGVVTPVPEHEMVLVPLVAFENTVIVPEFVPATVGVKVTATFWLLPALITLGKPELNPSGKFIWDTVRLELPLFVIVKVCCEELPTCTLPKFMLPLKLITRVAEADCLQTNVL